MRSLTANAHDLGLCDSTCPCRNGMGSVTSDIQTATSIGANIAWIGLGLGMIYLYFRFRAATAQVRAAKYIAVKGVHGLSAAQKQIADGARAAKEKIAHAAKRVEADYEKVIDAVKGVKPTIQISAGFKKNPCHKRRKKRK